jgi:DNA-binding transcriptional LysR family regulator
MTSLDWDDLRYVFAVHANGSVAGAARALRVNHTTVLRRIGAFESLLGIKLFDRLPTGYVLTAAGEELVETAGRINDSVTSLERRLAGRDMRVEGTLRLATTDTLMASVLPEILAAFRAAHPGVLVEVSTSNAFANLTRRGADVALRPAADPPENLVGRRLSRIGFAIYGSGRLVEQLDAERIGPADPAGLDWIWPDASLASTAVGRWMHDRAPAAPPVLRADSLVAMREAAAAGLGLAVLPCYLGGTDARLRRFGDPLPDLSTELWLLTHEDLRRTARVRAFMEFAGPALALLGPLLEGGRRERWSRTDEA